MHIRLACNISCVQLLTTNQILPGCHCMSWSQENEPEIQDRNHLSEQHDGRLWSDSYKYLLVQIPVRSVTMKNPVHTIPPTCQGCVRAQRFSLSATCAGDRADDSSSIRQASTSNAEFCEPERSMAPSIVRSRSRAAYDGICSNYLCNVPLSHPLLTFFLQPASIHNEDIGTGLLA